MEHAFTHTPPARTPLLVNLPGSIYHSPGAGQLVYATRPGDRPAGLQDILAGRETISQQCRAFSRGWKSSRTVAARFHRVRNHLAAVQGVFAGRETVSQGCRAKSIIRCSYMP